MSNSTTMENSGTNSTILKTSEGILVYVEGIFMCEVTFFLYLSEAPGHSVQSDWILHNLLRDI